jgi:hypothetical protein
MMQLYIWNDFCPDYTSGLAVAVASSLEEAKALVLKDCGFEDDWISWGSYYTKTLDSAFAIAVCGGS